MALRDLTESAVTQALDEFDQIGRERFLAKYGFKEARSYFLLRDGKHYDSKAVAAAAHAYVGVKYNPLKWDQLSGGESSAAPALRRLGFEVINTNPRNPAWVRDELILVLDFYLRFRSNIPDKSSQEIQNLSDEINKLDQSIGLAGGDTFRNTNGVYMKLMNFRRLDPNYTSDGRVGLSRGGKAEELVWNEFAEEPERLRETADAIRAGITNDDGIDEENRNEEEPEITEAEEGKLLTRVHRRRERNRKLVQQKKKAFEKKHGRVFCEACGFDFEKVYGSRGAGFIECHHTKPIHSLKPGEKTRLDDLKLLCSNCHRMVHARSRWLRFHELQKLVTR